MNLYCVRYWKNVMTLNLLGYFLFYRKIPKIKLFYFIRVFGFKLFKETIETIKCMHVCLCFLNSCIIF